MPALLLCSSVVFYLVAGSEAHSECEYEISVSVCRGNGSKTSCRVEVYDYGIGT